MSRPLCVVTWIGPPDAPVPPLRVDGAIGQLVGGRGRLRPLQPDDDEEEHGRGGERGGETAEERAC